MVEVTIGILYGDLSGCVHILGSANARRGRARQLAEHTKDVPRCSRQDMPMIGRTHNLRASTSSRPISMRSQDRLWVPDGGPD